MKLAWLGYICGWICVSVGIVFGIIGTIETEPWMFGRAALGLGIGVWWLIRGSKNIQRHRIEQQLSTFIKQNCSNCKFADREAIKINKNWCQHPAPSHDIDHCLSKEDKA